MQKLPGEGLRDSMAFERGPGGMDMQTAARMRKQLAQELREQLMIGAPTNQDESADTGASRLSSG